MFVQAFAAGRDDRSTLRTGEGWDVGMSRSARGAVVGIVLAAVVSALAFTFVYLISYPPTIAAAGTTSDNVTLQTVGAIGTGNHPTWVSYLAQQNGNWVHSTVIQVPANSDVHFKIYQYDSGSPLRNPFMDQVQGTTDGTETLNGVPVRIINDNADGGIGHTFAIPSLGVYVPLPGVPSTATNTCSTPAPCATTFDHNTVEFTIHTGAAGTYTWQCFVPCGLGYLVGNGGPMSTFGYMGGYLKVVA